MPSRTVAASSGGYGEEMRIGIDFHAAEREGTGNCTYIRNIVEQIVRIGAGHQYFLYVTDATNPYYDRFHPLGHVFLRPLASRSPFIRMLLLGLQTFRDRLDVLHATYYAPPVYRGKLVLTVHDLSFRHIPESFSAFDRIKDLVLVPIYMKRAKKILTVSEYSRRDIIETYRVPPSRVCVGYNGADPIFTPVADRVKAVEILRRYGIADDRGYILFVGRINKRKNLTGLVNAFNLLKETKGIRQRLVIVGNKDYLPPGDEAVITSSPSIIDILFTGYVPHEHLPVLYGLADVFVYPSVYEGFGLPCLEAMACACPVVSSDCTSIPEVVGDAGILIDPAKVDQLAGAIYRVLSDRGLRAEFVRSGPEKAKEFSWESAAVKVLSVLAELEKKT
jgi:glycosyltransferase involved in cell wall biosynthesis